MGLQLGARAGGAGGGAGAGAGADTTLKRKLVCLKMERLCLNRKTSFRMANSNKQFLFISFLRV